MDVTNENSAVPARKPGLVPYFEGMFSNEDPKPPSPFGWLYELRATCYHEAAHAVVGYAFGESIYSIGVNILRERRDGLLYESYGGEVRNGPPGQRLNVNYAYRPLHFRIGVTTAAGPAGERRYRLREAQPLRLLGATEDDHRRISGVAKQLERKGRCRFAYQRLVWFAAQRIVNRDDVWSAIVSVADELYYAIADAETEEPSEGFEWTYVDPRLVYGECRRVGLKRAMFRAVPATASRLAA